MEAQACQGCCERDQRIAELESVVRQLGGKVDELEAKLQELRGRSSRNSSTPPSADPPDAPKPPPKPRSGRKPGGQAGHPAQTRTRLPAELVTRVVNLVPETCEQCQQPLPQDPGPDDPEPLWHQVVDLPEVLVKVTEYRGHARTCACCGHRTQARIPADVRAHGFTPRFTAAVSALTGVFHLSKRAAAALVETFFGVPIALGSVAAAEQEASAALAPAHAEAAAAVQEAAAANVDETGWKQAGRRMWLWIAVTQTCTFFLIHARRSAAALSVVLKEAFQGIVTSDRWTVYNEFDAYQRQLCWAHLIRDFQALYERQGPGHQIGNELLCLAEDVFTWWYRVRDGTLARSTCLQYINAQRPWLRELLVEGAACGCAKTAALCRDLLAWEPALWTFVRREGVEPTNNAAERALRQAVLWRRRSFGCHSDTGCRFVERILTTVQTLKQNQRPVLDYLTKSIAALRSGRPAPKLLPV